MIRVATTLALASVIAGSLTVAASAQAFWPNNRGYAYQQDGYWGDQGSYAGAYGNGQYFGRDGGYAHFQAWAEGHNKYTTSGH